MGGVNALSPCTATAVVAAPRWGSKAPCFLPPPPRASMWAGAGVGALACFLCVCVCSCCSCPPCEARLWHPVPFFLAASPSGAEPAPVGCALQRCSRGPMISVENADIRRNACCATLLVRTATCFFPHLSHAMFFSLLQFSQLGSFLKTFSCNLHMLTVR